VYLFNQIDKYLIKHGKKSFAEMQI